MSPGLYPRTNHQKTQKPHFRNMPSLIYHSWTTQPSLLNLGVSTKTFLDSLIHRDLPCLHCYKHFFLFSLNHKTRRFSMYYKRSLLITTFHHTLFPYAFYFYMCWTCLPHKIRTHLKVRTMSNLCFLRRI